MILFMCIHCILYVKKNDLWTCRGNARSAWYFPIVRIVMLRRDLHHCRWWPAIKMTSIYVLRSAVVHNYFPINIGSDKPWHHISECNISDLLHWVQPKPNFREWTMPFFSCLLSLIVLLTVIQSIPRPRSRRNLRSLVAPLMKLI